MSKWIKMTINPMREANAGITIAPHIFHSSTAFSHTCTMVVGSDVGTDDGTDETLRVGNEVGVAEVVFSRGGLACGKCGEREGAVVALMVSLAVPVGEMLGAVVALGEVEEVGKEETEGVALGI